MIQCRRAIGLYLASVFSSLAISGSAQAIGRIEVVGHIGGVSWAVDVPGHLAYIGEGPTLKILDVSVPSSPVVVGRLLLPSLVVDIFVSGDTVYVVGGDLFIIGVSNPATPILLHAYDGSLEVPQSVCVAGGLAYVADPLVGLQILDVTNPSSPSLLGSHSADGPDRLPVAVDVAGDLAYVATHNWWGDFGSLDIIDVSAPSSPTLRASYDTPGAAECVFVEGNFAYVGDNEAGLLIIDVSEPSLPVLHAVLAVGAADIQVTSGLAYVANGTGLQAIDVSNPSQPQLRGTLNTAGIGRSVCVRGGLAYVADVDFGLHIIDVTEPSTPVLLARHPTMGSATSAHVFGGMVYVGTSPLGNVRQFGALQIIDASNPASPRYVGSCTLPTEARAVYVSGTMAYVGMWHENIWGQNPGGLAFVDVSNPTAPTLLNTYGTRAVYDVYAAETFAYAAIAGTGFQILDVADPSSPTALGFYPSLREGMQLVDNLAYSGNLIIDVTDPTSPTLVGWSPVAAEDVCVSGHLAYFAADEDGLQIVDVSNPSSPTIIGSWGGRPGPLDQAMGVDVYDGLAFVASGRRVWVIDVADPTSPTLCTFFDTADLAEDVIVDHGLIYIPDRLGGLLILRYTPAWARARPTWLLYE